MTISFKGLNKVYNLFQTPPMPGIEFILQWFCKTFDSSNVLPLPATCLVVRGSITCNLSSRGPRLVQPCSRGFQSHFGLLEDSAFLIWRFVWILGQNCDLFWKRSLIWPKQIAFVILLIVMSLEHFFDTMKKFDLKWEKSVGQLGDSDVWKMKMVWNIVWSSEEWEIILVIGMGGEEIVRSQVFKEKTMVGSYDLIFQSSHDLIFQSSQGKTDISIVS